MRLVDRDPPTLAIWRRWRIEHLNPSGPAASGISDHRLPYGLRAGASKANHLNYVFIVATVDQASDPLFNRPLRPQCHLASSIRDNPRKKKIKIGEN
jgi:hypothetical protein